MRIFNSGNLFFLLTIFLSCIIIGITFQKNISIYKKMGKRITIKDVAQSAGMSLATVSGVLNGETRFSEKTTRHVWEVANRLNYIPSASARGLRSGVSGGRVKTGIIMHIVHMSNVVPFHDRTQETDVYRLSWQARGHNLFSIPYCYYRQAGFQCPPLLNDLIDGAVIGTPHLEIVNIVKAKVPVVLMDVPFSMDFVDVPIVNIDHRYGFLYVMNELRKRGHRRIALICSSYLPEENFTSGETQMKKMIEDAACSAGLEIVPECSLCDSITAENHDAKMREYAQQIAPAIRAGRLTAIVAPHIYYHLSLKKEFALLGIRIPEDVSLIGHHLGFEAPGGVSCMFSDREALIEMSLDILHDQIDEKKIRCYENLLRPVFADGGTLGTVK